MQQSLGKAVLELQTDGKKFDKGMEDSEKRAQGFGSKIGSVAKVATVALAGIGVGAIALGISFAKMAAEEQVGMERLRKAVENTGKAWDEKLSASIETSIAAMERSTAFSDGEMRDALSLLTAMTGDVDEAMRRMAVAQDLARGTGMDLTAASKLLGKVTDENVNVLKKYGIAATEGMNAQELLNLVQGKFSGQAAAFAQTAAGQWQIFNNQVDNLKEDIGTALLPAFTGFASGAIVAIDSIRNGPLPAMMAQLGLVKDVVLEMLGVITGQSPNAGAALKKIAGEDGAGQIMAVLAKIRDFVRDDLIPGIVNIGTKTREIVDEIIVPKWQSALGMLERVTGGTVDLTTALIGFGVVMGGLKIAALGAAIFIAASHMWMFVAAVQAGTVAAVPLNLAFLLVMATILLVVAAALQVKETVDLVRDNWEKFMFALTTGKLNDIPFFGFFFGKIQAVLDFIQRAINLWNALQRLLGGGSSANTSNVDQNQRAGERTGFAAGGFTARGGAAFLHPNEFVIPAADRIPLPAAIGDALTTINLVVDGRILARVVNDQNARRLADTGRA